MDYEEDDYDYSGRSDVDDIENIEESQWHHCDNCGETASPPHYLTTGKLTSAGAERVVMAGLCVPCWDKLTISQRMHRYERHFPTHPRLVDRILDGE